ncbi:hypothetical protein BBJ28_00027122, partial [Nothophytophthora sp. Chile5]
MEDIDDIRDGSAGLHVGDLDVGQMFDSASAGVHAVQDYALQAGKSVKIEASSGMHRHITCTSSLCEFYVRLYRKRRSDKTYGPWYISSLNKEHVNCLSFANPTRRQIVELPTFASAVRADGSVTASALTDQIQSRDGISLRRKLRTLYRAREQVNDVGKEEMALSYQKIPDYLSSFADLNPGSVAFAEQDEQGSASIISVGREFGLTLKYCTLHIIRNLLARFPAFTNAKKNLIWALQASETEEEYTNQLTWIALDMGDEVKAYVADIPPARWCNKDQVERAFDFCQSCYLASSYVSAFKGKAIFIPIESELVPDSTWLPAKYIKAPGRPKTKRIRSVGEEGSGPTHRCTNCHE